MVWQHSGDLSARISERHTCVDNNNFVVLNLNKTLMVNILRHIFGKGAQMAQIMLELERGKERERVGGE